MTQRSPAGTPNRVNSNGSPKPDGTPTRVLVVIGSALGNLVAVTLRHGNYETRNALNETDIHAALRDWEPHLALIDIDHFGSAIDRVGGGMARGGMPILAFTRRRDTRVKLNAYEQGLRELIGAIRGQGIVPVLVLHRNRFREAGGAPPPKKMHQKPRIAISIPFRA